jgi:hypothetical protein
MQARFVALAFAVLVGLVPGIGRADGGDDPTVETAAIDDTTRGVAAKIRRVSPAGETHLAVELSVLEFIALQRLAEDERQSLLGLSATCRPSMTAVSTPSSVPNRLLVVIACAP